MPQNLSSPKKIIVILGPTASGKSELAVKLAKKFNGEIISADSRQVYKGLNIGAGKVPRDKNSKSQIQKQPYFYKGIRHYLLDVASQKRTFTVTRYQKLAKKALKDIIKRGKIPIVCGGTGLYIDALIYDLKFPKAPPQKKLRVKLEMLELPKLLELLKKLDPERYEVIDKKNKRRIIRAIEIAKTLGKAPKIKKISPYDVLKIGVSVSKEKLKKRINQRVDKMIKSGLMQETKRLFKKYPADLPVFNTIGYKEIIEYLRGKISLPEAISLIKKNTYQYAKRQMTWFRRYPDVNWIKKQSEAINPVKNFIETEKG
jgi:tRNA dimethylallyltransferase